MPPTPEGSHLGAALLPTVFDISNKGIASSNVVRMFNGGPANYTDIRDRTTFERAIFHGALSYLTSGVPCISVIGAAGVGKTTIARQIAVEAVDNHGYIAWEHRNEFPFAQSTGSTSTHYVK
jgi:hypothetical protein